MARKLDASGLAMAEAARVALVAAEPQLRAAGYNETADVVKRALREFRHPAYTGQVNTIGIQHAIR